jgi:hypothetical protein
VARLRRLPPVLACLLILASLLIAACQGTTVQVDAYPTGKGSALDCAALFGDLPPRIADQPRRLVAGNLAGAWGDPPIILRCGVEKPDALQPNSECHDVDGVGWLAEKQPDGWLFTTIGRRHYLSLEVPSEYDPAADALADVADLVARHVPVVKPCV